MCHAWVDKFSNYHIPLLQHGEVLCAGLFCFCASHNAPRRWNYELVSLFNVYYHCNTNTYVRYKPLGTYWRQSLEVGITNLISKLYWRWFIVGVKQNSYCCIWVLRMLTMTHAFHLTHKMRQKYDFNC